MALRGLSDDPVDDVVALLRSDQPVDAKTRKMMADALEGKSRWISMNLQKTARVHWIRFLIRDLVQVQLGRYANRQIQQLGRLSAIEQLAETIGKSSKAAEAAMTLARKVDKWRTEACNNAEHISYEQSLGLDLEFLAARRDKRTPAFPLTEEKMKLAALIKQYLDIENSALGHNERFIT